jgi:hypothetical protein
LILPSFSTNIAVPFGLGISIRSEFFERVWYPFVPLPYYLILPSWSLFTLSSRCLPTDTPSCSVTIIHDVYYFYDVCSSR